MVLWRTKYIMYNYAWNVVHQISYWKSIYMSDLRIDLKDLEFEENGDLIFEIWLDLAE